MNFKIFELLKQKLSQNPLYIITVRLLQILVKNFSFKIGPKNQALKKP